MPDSRITTVTVEDFARALEYLQATQASYTIRCRTIDSIARRDRFFGHPREHRDLNPFAEPDYGERTASGKIRRYRCKNWNKRDVRQIEMNLEPPF